MRIEIDGLVYLILEPNERRNPQIQAAVKQAAAENTWRNASKAKREAMGYWAGDEPDDIRYYSAGESSGGCLTVTFQRGYLSGLRGVLRAAGLGWEEADRRTTGAIEFPPHLSHNGAPVEWRTDQTPALDAMSAAIRAGMDEISLTAPTGSGKTYMLIEMARRLGQRFLVLVHTRDLARQWAREIKSALGWDAQYAMEGMIPHSVDQCCCCVYNTLGMYPAAARRIGSQCGLAIGDEEHLVPANTRRDAFALLPCKYRIGGTATHEREGGLDLTIDRVIGPVVYEVPRADTLGEGGIVPAVVAPYKLPWLGCADYDRHDQFITAMTECRERNEWLAGMIRHLSQNMPALALTGRVAHAEALAAMLPGSVLAHGKLPAKARRAAFAAMREAAATVGTADILGTGINVPMWSAAVLGTPWSSSIQTNQRLGRVIRPYPGKSYGLIIDPVDNHPLAWSAWSKRKAVYEKMNVQIERFRNVTYGERILPV